MTQAANKSTFQVVVLGLGTIGKATVRLLEETQVMVRQKYGFAVQVKYIIEKDFDQVPAEFQKYKLTTELDKVLADADIDLAIELIGGYDPAYEFVKKFLQKGVSVVTANKAMVDRNGEELTQLAAANNCHLHFGAAVGGGIPVLETIHSGLQGNNSRQILGILNGTTNYILTKMDKGQTYDDALAQAQAQGFAEADPTFDVEGYDTAQKISIIFSMLTQIKSSYKQFQVSGITNLKQEDLEFAKQLGFTLKLLGVIQAAAQGHEIFIGPTMVPLTHPLAAVKNETNAVHFAGAANITLIGEGAGGRPTANAVVSDVLTTCQALKSQSPYHVPFKNGEVQLVPGDNTLCEFYLKFYGMDAPGTFAAILNAMACHQISIQQAIQLESNTGQMVPLVLITHQTTVTAVDKALQDLAQNENISFQLRLRVMR